MPRPQNDGWRKQPFSSNNQGTNAHDAQGLRLPNSSRTVGPTFRLAGRTSHRQLQNVSEKLTWWEEEVDPEDCA
jgi:hypothetical protein